MDGGICKRRTGYLQRLEQVQRARQEFERVVERHPETDAGPEALYWTGVAKYSASHDAQELKELGRQFKERYTDTSWAKRASVW